MEINVSSDIKDSAAWSKEYHDKRNAAVAALVADGIAAKLWKHTGDLTRDEFNDEQLRWFFWRQYKPEGERSRSERAALTDASLYEQVITCMEKARGDEQKRLAKVISAGLKALLGSEFDSIMYAIAEENGIDIGRD